MRFKIDENLPSEFAKVLRRSAHDADTVVDEGMEGCPDPHIAAACTKEQRILVTLDRGFGDIRAYPPGQHAGIIVLAVARQDRPHLIAVLDQMIPLLDTHPIAGRLWIVDEQRVRMRGPD